VTNQPFFVDIFRMTTTNICWIYNMNNKAGVDIDAKGKWVNGERGQATREREE